MLPLDLDDQLLLLGIGALKQSVGRRVYKRQSVAPKKRNKGTLGS
jgi:hypothetical protein